MKKHSLKAAKRSVFGKKVKQLRKTGELPATVYGKKVKSTSVAVSSDAFSRVYSEAGETGLIELSIGSDMKPVLVHSVQVHPVSGAVLHVEFHQVDLKEKVHAKVPVEIVGTSPAVAQKLGVLLTVLDALEVEALPAELPEKIVADVTILEAVDQELTVGQMKLPSGVTVLTDSALTVVKVGPLVTKEAEAEAAAEEAAAAAASAASAESATGDASKPAEEKGTEAQVKAEPEKKT